MADIAEIGIRASAKGVKTTVTALGKLADQAVKVEQNVGSLQKVLDEIEKTNLTSASVNIRQLAMAIGYLGSELAKVQKVAGNFKGLSNSLTSLNTAAAGLASSAQSFQTINDKLYNLQNAMSGLKGVSTPISELRAEIGRLQSNITNAQASAQKGITLTTKTVQKGGGGGTAGVSEKEYAGIKKKAEDSDNAIYRMGRTAATVRNTVFNLFAAAGATELVAGIIRTADSMKNLEARLSLVTRGAQDLKNVQKGLLETANSTGVAVDELGTSYARLARSTKEMGIGSERLLKIQDGISKAFVIGGGSAGEFSSSLTQLTQGLASGR